MGMFSFVGDILGDITGTTAAGKASKKAAGEQLAFQQKGLDYLMESQAPVLARREAAAEPLMGFYTDPAQQAQFYQDATQSPTYDYLTGLGEESVLRSAAATGGLRGGAINPALASIQPQIAQMLVNQRLQGLQGFAQQQVNTGQVANQYGAMGATQAGGTLAQGRSAQDAFGMGLDMAKAAMMLGGTGGTGPSATDVTGKVI